VYFAFFGWLFDDSILNASSFFFLQDDAEQRIRERLDLQETMRQQMVMKERKKQAEEEEEEEFRQQVSLHNKHNYTEFDSLTATSSVISHLSRRRLF